MEKQLSRSLKSDSLVDWQRYLVAQQPYQNFSVEFCLASKDDSCFSYQLCRLFLTKKGKKCVLSMQQAERACFMASWSVCSI